MSDSIMTIWFFDQPAREFARARVVVKFVGGVTEAFDVCLRYVGDNQNIYYFIQEAANERFRGISGNIATAEKIGKLLSRIWFEPGFMSAKLDGTSDVAVFLEDWIRDRAVQRAADDPGKPGGADGGPDTCS